MKLSDLTGQSGEWLAGSGPQHEIVVSSRVRLARNVASYPFMSKANRLQRTELHKMCRERLLGLEAAEAGCGNARRGASAADVLCGYGKDG